MDVLHYLLFLFPGVFLVLSIFLWSFSFYRKVIFPSFFSVGLFYASLTLLFSGYLVISLDENWHWLVLASQKLLSLIILAFAAVTLAFALKNIIIRVIKYDNDDDMEGDCE
jgi:hypothetical protein